MRLEHGHTALGNGDALGAGAGSAHGSSDGSSPKGAHRIALQRVAFGHRSAASPEPPVGLLGAATGIREHRGLWRDAPPRLQFADDAIELPQRGDATAHTMSFDPGAIVLSAETGQTPGSRSEGRKSAQQGPWLDSLADVGKRVGDMAGRSPARVVWIDEVSDAAAALLSNGAADIVVRGEADETLPTIIEGAIAGRSDWRGERGVSWLEAGEVRHEREGATPIRLPSPAWDLIDLGSYSSKLESKWLAGTRLEAWTQKVVDSLTERIQKQLKQARSERRDERRGRRSREATIYTTRSCPTDCPTCHGSFGSHGRERPVDEIVHEIRDLVQRHRIRSLRIGDSAFDGNPARAEAIALAIAKLRSAPGYGYLTLTFPRGLRGDGLTPGLIKALISAGATSLPLRVTTASPRLQRLLKENIDLARVDTALAMIADRGARGHLLMRIGLPTETVGEVAHTIRWTRASHAATADFDNGRSVDLGPAWTQDQPGDIDDFSGLRRRALTSFYSSPARAGRLAKSFPTSLAHALQRRF